MREILMAATLLIAAPWLLMQSCESENRTRIELTKTKLDACLAACNGRIAKYQAYGDCECK
jgi:hypothetical protein